MTGPDPRTGRPIGPPTLRRELWAILVLYAAISVLPLLIGWAFG